MAGTGKSPLTPKNKRSIRHVVPATPRSDRLVGKRTSVSQVEDEPATPRSNRLVGKNVRRRAAFRSNSSVGGDCKENVAMGVQDVVAKGKGGRGKAAKGKGGLGMGANGKGGDGIGAIGKSCKGGQGMVSTRKLAAKKTSACASTAKLHITRKSARLQDMAKLGSVLVDHLPSSRTGPIQMRALETGMYNLSVGEQSKDKGAHKPSWKPIANKNAYVKRL
jgi:hypothetical protein